MATLELTEEQELFANKAIDEAKAIAGSKIDRVRARETIRRLYINAELNPNIPIIYAASPIAGAVIVQDETDGRLVLPTRRDGQSDAEFQAELDVWSDNVVPSMNWDEVLNLEPVKRNQILSIVSNDSVESEYRLTWSAALKIGRHLGHKINQEKCEEYIRGGEDIGWIIPYEEACIMIERPTLRYDDQGQFHGDGVPAISYEDGYCIYLWHRTAMPAKYGSVPSELWEPRWLLEEKNSELRKILIENIGYDRIIADLNGEVIDTWTQPRTENMPDNWINKYEILRFHDIDIEPVQLLKMVCPSTGHIHSVRIPPRITKAREAIKWVNHGIDPTDFEVQA